MLCGSLCSLRILERSLGPLYANTLSCCIILHGIRVSRRRFVKFQCGGMLGTYSIASAYIPYRRAHSHAGKPQSPDLLLLLCLLML